MKMIHAAKWNKPKSMHTEKENFSIFLIDLHFPVLCTTENDNKLKSLWIEIELN